LSKILTLTMLSLVETLVITLLFHGVNFQAVGLLAGVLIGSALYSMAGFWVVSRYDAVNEYLFPSMAYTLLFALPLIDYFGLYKSPLFYLHPLQAPLSLLKGAFVPMPTWEWVYGLVYGGLWLYLFYRICEKAFARFLVRKEGVH
jgi:fluoroquinolone transport system permease protein